MGSKTRAAEPNVGPNGSRTWRVSGRVLGVGALITLALIASACGGADADDVETAAVGAAGESDFPQFNAATVGGAQLDFGSLEGQDALLWFWAPW